MIQIILFISMIVVWVLTGVGIYRTLRPKGRIVAVIAGLIGGAAIGYLAGTLIASLILSIGWTMV